MLAVAGCGGRASPSPSPTATGLPAGTYTSAAFQPPVTFTIPAGWLISADSEHYFGLRPAVSDLVGVFLFRGPVAASQDPACPDSPAEGVAMSSSALGAWIGSLPGLAVSPPELVTVGGLRGMAIDVQIAAGWTQSCPYAGGLPAVPLFVGPDTFRWTVAGAEALRLMLLDGPDGVTIAVDVDAFDAALMPDLSAAAGPIVQSMTFKVG
jgi:hypothetical protein